MMNDINLAIGRGALGGIAVLELWQMGQRGMQPHEIIWLGLLATTLLMGAVLETTAWYRRRMLMQSVSLALVGLVVGFVLLDGAGSVLAAYNRIAWYDMVVHGVGGMTGVAVVLSWLRSLAARGDVVLPRWGMYYVALVTTLMAGVGFEFFEWLVDWMWQTHTWLGSEIDVLTDLGVSLVGGLIVSILDWFPQRRR